MGERGSEVVELLRERVSAIEAGHSCALAAPRPGAGGDCCESFDDEAQAAFERIVRLVSRRDHAAAEARGKLARAGFDDGPADRAVERAVRCGLIDDVRFAEAYVRSKLAQGKGAAGIERGLAALGIDASDVPGWPNEFVGEDAEVERALAVLERTPPRSKSRRDGAYRKLVARGFSAEAAASAACRWAKD